MKKKILTVGLIIAGMIVSCQKEEITITKKTNTCNCYERHEAIDTYIDANGFPKVAWLFQYNTTSQPDLCEKETGVWVYSGKPTSHKYKVICN